MRLKKMVRLTLRRLPLGLAGGAVALLLLSNPAAAVVVAYDNLSNGFKRGAGSNLKFTRGVRFTSTASGQVESVFVPIFGSNAVAEFSLFKSAGSQPGDLLDSVQVGAGGNVEITGWGSAAFLESGVEYWLVGTVVSGNTTWQDTNGPAAGAAMFYSLNSGASWIRGGGPLVGAKITVSPVPVPPAALLFLSALGALGAFMRRRANA